MIKFLVASPIVKTESFLTLMPARNLQLWRATLQHLYHSILTVLFNGFLSILIFLFLWGHVNERERLSWKLSMSLTLNSESVFIYTTTNQVYVPFTVRGSTNHGLPPGFLWQHGPRTSSWQHTPWTLTWPSCSWNALPYFVTPTSVMLGMLFYSFYTDYVKV